MHTPPLGMHTTEYRNIFAAPLKAEQTTSRNNGHSGCVAVYVVSLIVSWPTKNVKNTESIMSVKSIEYSHSEVRRFDHVSGGYRKLGPYHFQHQVIVLATLVHSLQSFFKVLIRRMMCMCWEPQSH